MKTLFIFLVLLSYNVHAQKSIFVRVYNVEGKKIKTGHVLMVTDTSLQLEGNPEPFDIPVRNIGLIKTKHSTGNNIFAGSLIGVGTFAIIGAASASSSSDFIQFSAGESAAAGAIVGLPLGAALGAITSLLKNSKTFIIGGDMNKLKAFQSVALKGNQ